MKFYEHQRKSVNRFVHVAWLEGDPTHHISAKGVGDPSLEGERVDRDFVLFMDLSLGMIEN